MKEWEKKSEGKRLRDFIEYLGYFDELDGDIHLEEEACRRRRAVDDRARRRRGSSFRTYSFCGSSKSDFPSGPRRPKFEFPPELMKEEKPQGDFQIQEERRLFYVALTRARQQLTLSTIVNKRKKPSPFLDDFLMNPKIQKLDAVQSAPKVQRAAGGGSCRIRARFAGSCAAFRTCRRRCAAYSRVALWAKAFHPPRPEPLQLSASAIDAYERCPMKYMFQYHVEHSRRARSAQ